MLPIQSDEQSGDFCAGNCHQISALGNSGAAKLIEILRALACGNRRVDARIMFSLHGTAKPMLLCHSIQSRGRENHEIAFEGWPWNQRFVAHAHPSFSVDAMRQDSISFLFLEWFDVDVGLKGDGSERVRQCP